MRVVRIEANFDAFLWTVSGHPLNKVESDLPPDAKVISVEIEHGRRTLCFYVESSAFADVPDGQVVPNWQPILTVSVTETSMLADLVSRRHDEIAEENQKLREILTANGISW